MDPIFETGNARVLLATTDPILRHTRTEILRRFGFNAVASDSADHAVKLIESTSVDVLILGNTLSPQDCHSIAETFRALRPHGRIVEIIGSPGEGCNDSPDATIIGLDGPQALGQVVAEQLRLASS